MPAKINIIGKTFGRLVVLSDAVVPVSKRTHSVCRCICGNFTTVSNDKLTRGHTQSCGCFMMERIKLSNTRHGHFAGSKPSRTAVTWGSMIKRCQSKYAINYADYGGRGISVCERWKIFSNFLEDMGEKPEGKTLERIDNNGNYEPGNCKWASPKEQARNRRNNIVVSVGEVSGCLATLSEHFKISYTAVKQRWRKGWTPEKTFLTPIRGKTREH